MGLKHLRQIEGLLNDNPEKKYTKTEIRDELGMNYNSVLDALAYLVSISRITKTQKIADVERYQWKKK